MVAFLTQLLLAIQSRFTRRARLEAENLLLRQQIIVLRRQRPRRVRLWNIDRLLLVWLYRLYPSLLNAIIIVQPETVIRWHRRGFRPPTGTGSPATSAAVHRLTPRFGADPAHEPREPAVGRCVQRRLARSVGDNPTKAKTSSLVAWMAGRRETNDLKPID